MTLLVRLAEWAVSGRRAPAPLVSASQHYLNTRARAAKARIEKRKRAKEGGLGAATAHHEAVRAKAVEAEEARQAEVYAEVALRAGDRCELSGAGGTDLDRLVNHHLLYGSGVDRDKATQTDLVIRIRDSLHKLIHRNPSALSEDVLRWCVAYGYSRAWKVFEKRLDKQTQARSASRAGGTR